MVLLKGPLFLRRLKSFEGTGEVGENCRKFRIANWERRRKSVFCETNEGRGVVEAKGRRILRFEREGGAE